MLLSYITSGYHQDSLPEKLSQMRRISVVDFPTLQATFRTICQQPCLSRETSGILLNIEDDYFRALWIHHIHDQPRSRYSALSTFKLLLASGNQVDSFLVLYGVGLAIRLRQELIDAYWSKRLFCVHRPHWSVSWISVI